MEDNKKVYYFIINAESGVIEIIDYITYEEGTYADALDYVESIKDKLLYNAIEELQSDAKFKIAIAYNWK